MRVNGAELGRRSQPCVLRRRLAASRAAEATCLMRFCPSSAG